MTWNIRYDNPDDGIHAWPGRRDELLSFVLSTDPDPGERLDYVFISDSVLVKNHCTSLARRPAGYLSDHLPVCADIVLR